MTNLRRTELTLHALTVVFVAVGGVALLRPPVVPAGETLPEGLDTQVPAGSQPDLTLADPGALERVVTSNIFSSSRRAPRDRYDPFAPPPDPFAPPASDAEMPAAPEPVDPDAVPRLYGTVTGPAGPAALLRLDPSRPEAQLYREGERGGAYRVEKIDGPSVVLVGPSGRIVLRLTPPPGQSGL
jgi:hypothetical protein